MAGVGKQNEMHQIGAEGVVSFCFSDIVRERRGGLGDGSSSAKGEGAADAGTGAGKLVRWRV